MLQSDNEQSHKQGLLQYKILDKNYSTATYTAKSSQWTGTADRQRKTAAMVLSIHGGVHIEISVPVSL